MARPTPAQDHLVSIVANVPGIIAVRAAERIGPNGSQNYGYRTIARALDAGRVVRVHSTQRHSTSCLYVPQDVPKGAVLWSA